MSAHIRPLSLYQGDPEILAQIKEIFFESSSKKDFKDELEKTAFFEKYLGYYFKHYPEYIWVAEDQKILGYVAGSPVTGTDFYKIQPHLTIFEKHYKKYPAHLHINCHVDSRGLGVGARLVAAVEEQLMKENIHGLHIITDQNSRNQSFYQKLGFSCRIEGTYQDSTLLFMGKSLS